MADKTMSTLKVRDDHEPIKFKTAEQSDGGEQTYKLSEGISVNWVSGDSFTVNDLRGRIEPWLTSLFQSEHLSLLVGSGLTTAIQAAAIKSADNGMGEPEVKSKYSEKIKEAVKKSVDRNGRGEANIEDYIRVINDLLRGLEALGHTGDHAELQEELNSILCKFVSNISEIEKKIAMANDTNGQKLLTDLSCFS